MGLAAAGCVLMALTLSELTGSGGSGAAFCVSGYCNLGYFIGAICGIAGLGFVFYMRPLYQTFIVALILTNSLLPRALHRHSVQHGAGFICWLMKRPIRGEQLFKTKSAHVDAS